MNTNALFCEVGDEVAVRCYGRVYPGTVIYPLDRTGCIQVETPAAAMVRAKWRSFLFNAETLIAIAAPADLILPQSEEEWRELRAEMNLPPDLERDLRKAKEHYFRRNKMQEHTFEFTTEPTEYEPHATP